MADLTTLLAAFLEDLYAGSITLSGNVSASTLTLGADVVLSRGAANRLDLASGDSFNIVSGNAMVAGAVTSSSATAGIGYATGAGGTVTQGSGSGKATAVTLNTVCGTITMDAAILNAGTTVAFQLTNSAIALTDYVQVQWISGGTSGSYLTTAAGGAGFATVYVTNRTAGNLTEAPVLKFIVFKAVTS
jgi:hypothetical protein